MNRAESILRMLRILAGIALLLTLTVQALRLPGIIGAAVAARLDPTIGEARRASATVADFAASVSKDYYDPGYPQAGWYWLMRTDWETSAVASRTMAEAFTSLNTEIKRADIVLEQTFALLGDTNASLNEPREGLLPVAAAVVQRVGKSADLLLADTQRQINTVMPDLMLTSAEARNRIAELQPAFAEIQRAATATADSAENVRGATKNMDDATKSIKDMLSPTKKSFWRRILELMIPRPTIRVGG